MRTETRTTPTKLGFYRGTGARNRAFNDVASYTCNRQRDQHRQEDARPLLAAQPPSAPGKNETEREVDGPIAEPSDVVHEIEHVPVSMVFQERMHRRIEVKRDRDGDGGNHDAQKPIRNGAALHK